MASFARRLAGARRLLPAAPLLLAGAALLGEDVRPPVPLGVLVAPAQLLPLPVPPALRGLPVPGAVAAPRALPRRLLGGGALIAGAGVRAARRVAGVFAGVLELPLREKEERVV